MLGDRNHQLKALPAILALELVHRHRATPPYRSTLDCRRPCQPDAMSQANQRTWSRSLPIRSRPQSFRIARCSPLNVSSVAQPGPEPCCRTVIRNQADTCGRLAMSRRRSGQPLPITGSQIPERTPQPALAGPCGPKGCPRWRESSAGPGPRQYRATRKATNSSLLWWATVIPITHSARPQPRTAGGRPWRCARSRGARHNRARRAVPESSVEGFDGRCGVDFGPHDHPVFRSGFVSRIPPLCGWARISTCPG